MNGHLVAVEVGIECSTCQWVELNSLAFDHLWLECLDTETVKCWSTVEQHRMTLHYIFKDVPNYRFLAVDNFLGALYCLHDTALNEFADDEWFVKLSSHIFRYTALMHLQFRANDDNRTC